MIIGNGQIASQFRDADLASNLLIFASGVSDSNCVDLLHFNREKQLIRETIDKYPHLKFVYFSSCSLSQKSCIVSTYYSHKREVENIIQESSRECLILRVPQIFSHPKVHTTLIHFLYHSIMHQKEFRLNYGATRYLLDVADVPLLVSELSLTHNVIIDVANPYKYSVKDIVADLELIISKKAIYSTYFKRDSYDLSLGALNFLSSKTLARLCGKNYFYQRMSMYHTKACNFQQKDSI